MRSCCLSREVRIECGGEWEEGQQEGWWLDSHCDSCSSHGYALCLPFDYTVSLELRSIMLGVQYSTIRGDVAMMQVAVEFTSIKQTRTAKKYSLFVNGSIESEPTGPDSWL